MKPLPLTIPDLVERIEQLFDCRDGPYQSYVVHAGLPYSYVTLGWLGVTDKQHTDEYVIFRLREALFGQFYDLAAPFAGKPKPVLYWRYAAALRIGEESSKRRKYYTHKIRTRVAIPEAYEALTRVGIPEGSMIPNFKYPGDRNVELC